MEDETQDEIQEDIKEEIQEIKSNSKKKNKTKEEIEIINQTRRENLKKGREKLKKINEIGKLNLEKKTIIEEVKPEPIKKPITKKIVEKIDDDEEEPLSEKEIREYIRLKKIEDDKLKRVYLLKSQKEQEERFKRGYASLFGGY